MKNDTFRAELRAKFPERAERAKKSPKLAIRMFCIECMGGSVRDAKGCETTDCFLHPVRGAAWQQ